MSRRRCYNVCESGEGTNLRPSEWRPPKMKEGRKEWEITFCLTRKKGGGHEETSAAAFLQFSGVIWHSNCLSKDPLGWIRHLSSATQLQYKPAEW